MDGLQPLAVSPAECARLLGVSRPTVYTIINQDGFPSFKLGTRTLISVDGLRAWIAKKTEVNQE
ncbi:helix-turn-helix domain-containing protein [Intestinimonas butyriciproducens]|uniref:helix-turn-helix domain-containing protein n=1 Tax=Intestinimonas butyriciproducens TaxID=1297617 RepID=UPI00195C67C5|nr:helix-turn-helix domain-containing protein [Intestinimonas butyriciproducens]